jgi:tRNA (mo5U34)-methyltransferase
LPKFSPSSEPRPGTGDLRAEVARTRWFHTIDLGEGIVTPGVDDSARKLRWLHLPEDLSGMTVLDVGAWDGFFSFECERRGAARVVAVDPVGWGSSPDNARGSKAGFEIARRALGSAVEDLELDSVLDLSPERVGTFDVVLFLGVLYHLRDPLTVLERVTSVAGDLFVLETHVDLIGRRPAMAFYPGDEVDGDHSTWWGPNPSLLHALLGDRGFADTRTVHLDPRARRLLRATRRRLRGTPYRARWGRCVIHARRDSPR